MKNRSQEKKSTSPHPTQAPGVWTMLTSYVLERPLRRGRIVLVFVQASGPGKFLGLALETVRSADVSAVLNDHAHEALGVWPSLELAQEACARYAYARAAGMKAEAARCLCKRVSDEVFLLRVARRVARRVVGR